MSFWHYFITLDFPLTPRFPIISQTPLYKTVNNTMKIFTQLFCNTQHIHESKSMSKMARISHQFRPPSETIVCFESNLASIK